MKVVRFKEAESYEPEKDWRRVSLCSEDSISIEHFIKPAKHASPRHSHPNAQILIVLSGRLQIETDSQTVELGPFDTAYIDGNEEHVVINPLQEPSAGLDIFVPGRSFDFWLKRKK
ncbi:MAG: cupin domain-containing protein [Caldisericaceae bacterium]|nr:cupin domain-containing protein [Caldisericaceae bacterium]